MDKINNSLTDISRNHNRQSLALMPLLGGKSQASKARALRSSLQIGKLAEDNRTIKEIFAIIEEVNIAANEHRKYQRKEAVNLGNEFISNVRTALCLEKSIEAIRIDVDKEDEMITDISSSFDAIMEQLESISSVSEEHAAATEEVLAAIETQYDLISKVTNEMSAIKAQSSTLRNILDK